MLSARNKLLKEKELEYLIIWIALTFVVYFAYSDSKRSERNDTVMFLTHTPWAFQVGNIKDDYVITRIKQVQDTALITGGTTGCWEVYGCKNNR